MELSEQVVNLELSKKLKELGVKQYSIFKYSIDIINCKYYVKYKDNFSSPNDISAFTASELLELLPLFVDISKREEKDYMCRVMEKNYNRNHHSFDENLANSCAKMLIYLLENNLM